MKLSRYCMIASHFYVLSRHNVLVSHNNWKWLREKCETITLFCANFTQQRETITLFCSNFTQQRSSEAEQAQPFGIVSFLHDVWGTMIQFFFSLCPAWRRKSSECLYDGWQILFSKVEPATQEYESHRLVQEVPVEWFYIIFRAVSANVLIAIN